MKGKLSKSLLLIVLIFICLTMFFGCSLLSDLLNGETDNPDTDKTGDGDVSDGGEQVSISFNTNGGKLSSSYIATYQPGGDIALPVASEIIRANYDFVGWHLLEDLSDAVITEISSVGNDGIIVYAEWKIKEYTVRYILPSGATHTNSEKYTCGETLSLSEAILGNHGFRGWYYDESCEKTAVKSIAVSSKGNVAFYDASNEYVMDAIFTSNTITLYGAFDSVYYTLTYNNLDGGSIGDNPTRIYDDDAVTLKPAIKNGYDFVGWYRNASLEGDAVTTLTSVTENIQLYAKWQAKTYEITYALPDNATHSNIGTYTFGETLRLSDANLADYTFEGWYYDEECESTAISSLAVNFQGNLAYYDSSSNLIIEVDTSAAITLYASFDYLNYSITYNNVLNGTHDNPTKIYVNETITLKDASRTAYDFLGWYTSMATTSEKVTSLSTITHDVTLYAKWKAKGYSITYSIPSGATHSNPSTYTIEDSWTLSAATLTNYTFYGWYYDNGYTRQCLTLKGTYGDVTLYGHFVKSDELSLSASSFTFNKQAPKDIEVIAYNLTSSLCFDDTYYLLNDDYSIDDAAFVVNTQYSRAVDSSNTTFVVKASYLKNIECGTYTYLIRNTKQPITFTITVNDSRMTLSGLATDVDESGVPVLVWDAINVPITFTFGNRDRNVASGASSLSLNGLVGNNVSAVTFTTTISGYSSTETVDIFTDYVSGTLDSSMHQYLSNNTDYSKEYYTYMGITHNKVISTHDELVNIVEYVIFTNCGGIGFVLVNTDLMNGDIINDASRNIGKIYSTSMRTLLSGHFRVVTITLNGGEDLSPNIATTQKAIVDSGIVAPCYTVNDSGNTRNFPIDSLSLTQTVTTSNQLYLAVEKGVKPTPTRGSVAEYIYNKAKDVLSKIITDSMTDYEKIHYIYDWIIFNTTYDYELLEITNNGQASMKYYSFHLEGVFGNGSNYTGGFAVCDGLSKAAVLMLNIEGIDAYRIVGEAAGGGHAWVKYLLEGEYINMDVTWGNEVVSDGSSSTKYLSHAYLAVNDNDLMSNHFETNCKDIALGDFSFYDVSSRDYLFSASTDSELKSIIETYAPIFSGIEVYLDGDINLPSVSFKYRYKPTGYGSVIIWKVN